MAVQVLIAGKISQAAVLAAAAYRDEETFQRVAGISQSRLVIDQEGDTHVRTLLQHDMLHQIQQCLQLAAGRSARGL